MYLIQKMTFIEKKFSSHSKYSFGMYVHVVVVRNKNYDLNLLATFFTTTKKTQLKKEEIYFSVQNT